MKTQNNFLNLLFFLNKNNNNKNNNSVIKSVTLIKKQTNSNS